MKKGKTIIAAIVLLLVFVVGGAVAYFTDTDEVTNTFTIGSVEIEVQEDAWEALLENADVNDNDIPDAAENMMPGESVAKDPKIHNKSETNEAYVFMKVVSPCTTGSPALELFDYSGSVNSGWEIMSAYSSAACSNGTITRIYSYSTSGTMTALAPESATLTTDDTPTLFDSLTLNTNVTGNIPNNTDVVITGYAVQKDGISATAPNAVWTAANFS